jgi:3-oxoadipate enol-lactonase
VTEPKTVTIDDLIFRIQVEGPEGAPWLVFSNSLLTNLSMWDEQAAVLNDRFRILRYDQRGHGGTAVPTVPCTFERLADDVAELMDQLGISSTAFVGLSMGAATGLAFAARHPHRVTRMMLCDSPAVSPTGAPAMWQARIEQATLHGVPALVEATLLRWFRPETLSAAPSGIRALKAAMNATPLAGFVACAAALMDFDLTAALRSLNIPVLLAAGAADGVLPAAMCEMAEKIPGGVFREIAEAGHLPNIEQPATFLLYLKEALATA